MPSVLLTRTAEDNMHAAPAFERLGLTVFSVPMIELQPLPCDACGIRSVRRIAGGAPVLITSAHAAELWLDLRETDFRETDPEAYYVVGETSAALLRDADPGVPIRAVADTGEELLRDRFDGVPRMLYPCSAHRRDDLVEGLRERGVDVVDLPLYTPVPPSDGGARLRAAFDAAPAPIAIAFFSPSAVHNFFSLPIDIPAGAIFGAIGRTTADALREHGVEEVIVPASPGSASLAQAIGAALASSGR